MVERKLEAQLFLRGSYLVGSSGEIDQTNIA